MSATRFSRQECIDKWGRFGQHPVFTVEAHNFDSKINARLARAVYALTAPDRQRTEMPLRLEYWAWVAEKVAGSFRK